MRGEIAEASSMNDKFFFMERKECMMIFQGWKRRKLWLFGCVHGLQVNGTPTLLEYR